MVSVRCAGPSAISLQAASAAAFLRFADLHNGLHTDRTSPKAKTLIQRVSLPNHPSAHTEQDHSESNRPP